MNLKLKRRMVAHIVVAVCSFLQEGRNISRTARRMSMVGWSIIYEFQRDYPSG